VVAGVIGFFVVLRGAAFVADAVPQSAFTGAAAASLLGINTLIGLAAASLAGALGRIWATLRNRRSVRATDPTAGGPGSGALAANVRV
jgi:zinc/manganese transport system permease protein